MNTVQDTPKKIHRFIGDFEPVGGRIVIPEGALAHQIRRVLKLRAGEQVAFAGGGREYLARLARLDDDGVVAEVVETAASDRDPAAKVTLYCAVVKKENFELVAQKATEIGAAAIVPVVSRRTVKLNVRMERLRTIAREAAEQCGRNDLPLLSEPLDYAEALRQAAANGMNWFFDPSGRSLAAADQAAALNAGRLGLFIGPEGGWDGEEIAAAARAGCRVLSLGRLVFRAETAAVAACYLACWPPAR